MAMQRLKSPFSAQVGFSVGKSVGHSVGCGSFVGSGVGCLEGCFDGFGLGSKVGYSGRYKIDVRGCCRFQQRSCRVADKCKHTSRVGL